MVRAIVGVTVGLLLVGLLLMVTSTARADGGPRNVCVELHCYCDGPDEPDTVGPCETTCEELCVGRSTGGGHKWAAQRISLGASEVGIQEGDPQEVDDAISSNV